MSKSMKASTMRHGVKKKKPSYVPESAWQVYQTYNELPDIKLKGKPLYDEDMSKILKKDHRDFFEKIFFSDEAGGIWKIFPEGKDAGEFVRFIYNSRINSDIERSAKQRSKTLQRAIVKNIEELKDSLKNAGYIFALHNFINNNGTLKAMDSAGNLRATNILEILDSLKNFVANAGIGIKGTAYTSKMKAISASRQRNDAVDFTRCLYNEMKSTGFKNPKSLISVVLPCLFTEKRYDGKDWLKFVHDTLKERKLD